MKLILLVSLVLAALLQAQDKPSYDRRERPLSFIHDPSNWLTRDIKVPLEDFLRARSNNYNTEVFLLLAPLPAHNPDQARLMLQEIGKSWSPHNWAIISYAPDQIRSPMVVLGGPFYERINVKNLDHEVQLIRDLSSQAWEERPDIDFLVHKISDTLTFNSRANDAYVQELARAWRDDEKEKLAATESKNIRLGLIAAIASAILITTLLLLWKLYLSCRKMTFPLTRWKKRLGAPHSGGSSVNHRF